jgi:hypothetical protein
MIGWVSSRTRVGAWNHPINHGVFSAEDLPSIQATIEQEIVRATQILGLTIVKQILNQHEFNIRLTLQENQFCIMFETK